MQKYWNYTDTTIFQYHINVIFRSYMNILVIPTTDWIRHPIPNRLNFIFDILAERNSIFVLHFNLRNFAQNQPRMTNCTLIEDNSFQCKDPSLFYLLNSPVHLANILRTVKERKIDLILSSNIIPSFLANFAGVPVVFDYLDHLEESASIYYPDSIWAGLIKRVVRLLTRYNLRHATGVITVTSELKDYLAGIGRPDAVVIPNGVDTNLLRPLPKETAKLRLGIKGNIIGYVGSLEHWVDLETVVQALPNLDVTLLVVGPGLFTDYGAKIQALAEKTGVADRILFTGPVPYEQLGNYISAMDIGLNPLKKLEKNEFAAGGKVFNYLACGRPVLSSRMISLVNLLGDDLFYYDDMESFTKQVQAILQKKPEEERYRAIAEKFNWRKLSLEYEKVLLREL
jgi:glycosyltransferase involved in cell wall biosynthesis